MLTSIFCLFYLNRGVVSRSVCETPLLKAPLSVAGLRTSLSARAAAGAAAHGPWSSPAGSFQAASCFGCSVTVQVSIPTNNEVRHCNLLHPTCTGYLNLVVEHQRVRPVPTIYFDACFALLALAINSVSARRFVAFRPFNEPS